ncbi:MAG: aconitate hydratase [Candidatus Neomarinimicrobiota bacterium]|nr:aconitate hydratase [Candidatus Neomarinimicrobiota bacterium]
MFDLEIIKFFYKTLESKTQYARDLLQRPLTFTEKVLFAHVIEGQMLDKLKRGSSYVDFNPDRVAMQDATAQMALLQFIMAGKEKVAVPTTVHCDHLIQAKLGADKDLVSAKDSNYEVYSFLESVSKKYGIGFWEPGAGIIHQVVLENYAFPGGMMVGTDSHTVNAGGLGMVAIGVGGADAVDVMVGMPWELKFPEFIGVRLTGKLNGWASAKDIILKVAGILTVKGGTGSILEYFGPGADNLSCTGKGTICNMGAEIGATTSIFSYDHNMANYLRSTDRNELADLADQYSEYLTGDNEVYDSPEKYFDEIITIDLNTLEPHINGPFTPDLATPISEFAKKAEQNDWPLKLDVGLIGSCTNSSYEDITRAASIAEQALKKKLKVKSDFTVTPGSEQVRFTVDRDGYLDVFREIGGLVLANACGPCIGQWAREGAEKQEKNSIITSFNRNFAKRADGNPNTYGFVASPEIVTAMAIAGDLRFNPLKDTLVNAEGDKVTLEEPSGIEFPPKGFAVENNGYKDPDQFAGEDIVINVDPESKRLQLLEPFEPWDGENITSMKLLIKAKGKCTTDHISMAGPWLFYRGHLDNISNNLLTGAINFFNDKPNHVKNQIDGTYGEVPDVQRMYKSKNIPTIVVGDENYGEGSSREHAAMEPRHLGVMVVLVRSFARIHETNLKKQGMLALTFKNKDDYDKIFEDDTFNFINLDEFSVGKTIVIEIFHSDRSNDIISCNHTYNNSQIDWFRAGSALNLIRSKQSE